MLQERRYRAVCYRCLPRQAVVAFIDWLNGRRGSKLNVMGRFPNLALARRVATPPALLRLKPEAALQGQTNAAETNRKGVYRTLARQADEAECRAVLRRPRCDESSSL